MNSLFVPTETTEMADNGDGEQCPLLLPQAVLRDVIQHGRRTPEPGGRPGCEVHGARVHPRPDLAAPQSDRGGRPDHPEHEAAAAQGDHLRAGCHQASHQG